MRTKDIDIIRHIRNYSLDIEKALKRFGEDKEIFENDTDYRNSVCMSLLQIGELTGHLSEDYRETTKELVYWPAIKGMRNVFAHDYGAIDYDRVWDTVIEDIPILLEFCQKEILAYQMAESEEEFQNEDMER